LPSNISEEIMSPKKPDIGAAVKRLREVKEMTQLELAKKSGVPQGYISQLETRDRKQKKSNPGLKVVMALAKALGVPVTELLG
jgi:transcriptional regulator with XRE-family HTH domain